MASITLCPRCSSHLELPTGVAPTSLVECPICEAEFLLASVAPRAIPKARVVEQSVEGTAEVEIEAEVAANGVASAAIPLVPSTFSIVVDEEAESADAAPDTLSRLLRSSADWQLSGVQLPRDDDSVTADIEEEASLDLETSDDLIIPNDHAPRTATFGDTLDAAYRDADPALSEELPANPEELKLGSSRLDQLLSDLMKSPATQPLPDSIDVGANKLQLPSFAEVEAEADEDEPSAAAVSAEWSEDAQEFNEVEVLDEPEDDRWNKLHESAEHTGAEHAHDEDYDEQLDEADEVTDGPVAHDDFRLPELDVTPRRIRRPAGLRTLVGVVGGGAIGILGGAYALLWLRGPSVDVLQMANWLPPAMLPAAMQPLAGSESSQNELPAPEPASNPLLAEDEGLPPVPPTSTTLDFAEPAAESAADHIVEASPDEEPAAASPEPADLHHDPAVTTATAVEPLAADSVAPTPAEAPQHWPTTPIVGQLRNPKWFTVADLSALLPDADAAHRRFLAGDLSRKEDVAGMGQAYIELCKLAECFTLTNPNQLGNELISKQITAKNIFRGTAGLPARRSDLAMIAGRWLQHNRRPNNGVLLVGKVTDLQAQGPWTEYTIETPLGDSTAISKVLMEGLPFPSGAEVAVVGTIVVDPRQAITGYQGDAPQVIVSGFAFAPEEFTAPKMGGVSGASGDLFSFGE